MAPILAEVLMVVIVIVMSTIVYVWVVPAFTSQTSYDNAGAAYSEKFNTVRGQFATFVQRIPETIDPCTASPVGCSPSSPFVTCNGSITSSYSGDVIVPINGVCVITASASVHNVFVMTGANLTVVSATINGDLIGNYSQSITLRNAIVSGWTGLYNVQTTNISGSSLNTSGNLSISHDGCCSAMYGGGGGGSFSMTNSTVTGQIENEVGHQTYFVGNHVSGRLEVESADQGSIIGNTVGSLDLDQNGVVVVASNTVNGSATYGTNGWCGTGYNVISGGTTGSCVGNVEVDVLNTGSIPVKFVSAYMTNIPLAGNLTWQLASGNQVQCGTTQSLTCTKLPIIIPVGDMAQITMGWTPPASSFPLPWNYIYFIFVSSHQNYVDGYLYFSVGLGLPMQSRLENRICPPCW
jgi:hypothetical protein